MPSSIVIPLRDRDANYPPGIMQKLVDVATAAQADINAILAGGGQADFEARFATTANLNLATTGLTVVDGVTPVAGDVALVKNQSTASQNGLYVVGATAWARLKDASGADVLSSTMLVNVSEGTANLDTIWMLTTNAPITVGSTALTFAQKASLIATSTPLPSGIGAAGATGTVSDAGHAHPQCTVRGVCFANQSLSAFVGVAGGTPQDGLTYLAGQRVLLANQTTAADNGIYAVGTVAAGTAPLTRVADMPAAATYNPGQVVEVSEGTLFAGSTWKAMCVAGKVVGTDDPLFYPRVCKGILTLASGTKSLGATEGLFLWSATTSVVTGGFNTAGGTVSSTTGWRCASAGRTPGKSGTAAATIIAILAAGTINAADNSTFDWQVCNF